MIDFVEFIEMWAKYSGDIDETIQEAFSLFDRDGSGRISKEEFRCGCFGYFIPFIILDSRFLDDI